MVATVGVIARPPAAESDPYLAWVLPQVLALDKYVGKLNRIAMML